MFLAVDGVTPSGVTVPFFAANYICRRLAAARRRGACTGRQSSVSRAGFSGSQAGEDRVCIVDQRTRRQAPAGRCGPRSVRAGGVNEPERRVFAARRYEGVSGRNFHRGADVPERERSGIRATRVRKTHRLIIRRSDVLHPIALIDGSPGVGRPGTGPPGLMARRRTRQQGRRQRGHLVPPRLRSRGGTDLARSVQRDLNYSISAPRMGHPAEPRRSCTSSGECAERPARPAVLSPAPLAREGADPTFALYRRTGSSSDYAQVH